MARLSVDVPEELKTDIEETAERKNYKNSSEYIRQALREKLEKDSELDAELLYRILELRRGKEELKDIDKVIEKYGEDEDNTES